MTLNPSSQPDARRVTETPPSRKVPALTDIELDRTTTQANRAAAYRRPSGRNSLIVSMGVLAAATSALLGPASAQTASVTASASSAASSTPQAVSVDLTARAAAAGRSSRSSSREKVSESANAAPEAVATRYATVALNVRSAPDSDADLVTVLDASSKVKVTEETDDGWQEILYKGEAAWVNGKYLAKRKPSESDGLSTRACAGGSGVERGLKPNAVAVHRAVCARFPQIKVYGGYRSDPGSNHNSGRAVDIMLSGSLGDDVAAWLKANASELGITELIWEQRIWTTQRAGDGWRRMEDRGSATANHFDHVHVSVS